MINSFDNIPEIADDYVLGLLEPDDMVRVEAEINHNEELKRAIASSRERFLPLDTSIAPMSVNEDIWQSIVKQLSDARAPSTVLTESANDNSRTIGRWKLAALSTSAASILLALGLGWSLTRTAEPIVIAVLLNERGNKRKGRLILRDAALARQKVAVKS